MTQGVEQKKDIRQKKEIERINVSEENVLL
jgi:hypothetical protein